MKYLPFFLTPLVLSWGLTWIVRLMAYRVGLLDAPRADRWHRRPVPRLGGIAIFLGFTLPALVWQRADLRSVMPLLAGGGVIFLIGLIDDLKHLQNQAKLFLLIVCSILPVLFGVRFTTMPATIGFPLAIFWVLGTTNAFNWLDNMDGVAAGVAVIVSANFFALSLLAGGNEVSYLPVMMAGAAFGFLVHNFPPARVFMGDSGSGFLGFGLATIALLGPKHGVPNVLAALLVPGLILAVPIFDTAVVTVQRLLNHRSLFQGGRDHPAHRLVALGLLEREAVLMLYGLSLLSGVVALAATFISLPAGLGMSLLVVLGYVVLGLVLSEVRIYDMRPDGDGITPLPQPLRNKN